MDGKSEMIPLPDLIGHATGSQDATAFINVGKEFFGYFTGMCGLQPTERVLDLGCGCCRMALPLLDYLKPPGCYDGIDIHKADIDWATTHVTNRWPNFRFHHADIHNLAYNPGATLRPEDYRLPFDDNTFDFAFLTSVFTHMLPAGMRNYMAELARVLKVGGRLLNTFFLLNDDAAGHIRAGTSGWHFPFQYSMCAVQSQERPEDGVAFRENDVRKLYDNCGMNITAIVPGNWCGRPNGLSCLDLVIATKVRQPARSAGRPTLRESLDRLFRRDHPPRFKKLSEFARAA